MPRTTCKPRIAHVLGIVVRVSTGCMETVAVQPQQLLPANSPQR